MSTVTVTFRTQILDGGQSNRGVVTLQLDIQGTQYSLDLELSPIVGYGRFVEVPWVDGLSGEDEEQANNYRLAINRDFSFIGNIPDGTPQRGNVAATVNGNVVTITATIGTFSNASYTGDVLQSVDFVINNTPQSIPKTFSYSATGNGDCDTEEYQATSATGGTAPYRLQLGSQNVISGWSGSNVQTFDLDRNKFFSGGLYDSNDELIRSVSINPTKKLNASDFETEIIPQSGFSDLEIVRVVSRAGTDPLEYRIDSGAWQSENRFGGLTQGIYTVGIRDRYLCEVTKTVVIQANETPTETAREPYFKVSEYNSLSYFRQVTFDDDVRSNYENTPTWLERTSRAKNDVFEFPVGSNVITEFKSSFPFHNVTLYRKGQPSLPIQFFLIQENLGVTEKVDCKAFPLSTQIQLLDSVITITTGTAIYFDGGQQYEPNSTTVKADPDSPYTSGLPGWAVVGNTVEIDGIGTKEIVETNLYDEDRGVSYFRVEGSLAEGDYLIQSSWDRHPYNYYRFEFEMAAIGEDGGHIIIEPGYSANEIDQRFIHRSEFFRRIVDTSKYLKFQWSAFRTIGDLLFLSGYVGEMWLKGRITPYSDGEAETNDADDRTRSIDQKSYLRMRAFTPVIGARKWRKLDLISAIGNRGTLLVEDMEVIRLNPIQQEEQGESNLSNITLELAIGGETSINGQSEPVLDVSTGNENGGFNGIQPVSNWQSNGNRLTTDSGEFVKILDGDVEMYVEIL